MSTITKANLRDMILEHIQIKPAGQNADGNDAALVERAIDSAHDQLNKLGLVPFATSAIPEWAQFPFRDYVTPMVKPSFGIPSDLMGEQQAAKFQFREQLAGYKHSKRTRAEYF